MEMNAFPFLDRRWEVDESILTDALDYYSDLDLNYKVHFSFISKTKIEIFFSFLQLLLFPEGTDYCILVEFFAI